MKKYELMVIINPDIGEDATTKRLEAVRKLITSQEGEIFYEDIWGLRDLAYRIKKQDKGYYAVLDFNFEGDLKEIDTTFRLDNDILRHMIVLLPSTYEPKSFAKIDEEEEEKPVVDKRTHKKVAPKKEEKEDAKATTKKAVEEKESVKVAKKEEEKEAPSKEEDKKEPSLEDVDAKLKSIIDNPDLNF